MLNKTSSQIVADSKAHTFRLTTFKSIFWRGILSEVNTHKMISKNSASSRAIPFAKMVKSVTESPFVPIKFMKEHTGMQGTEYFEDLKDIKYRIHEWLIGRDNAVEQAKILNSMGITKQVCNRLLEPFLYHTALLSGTEWNNFFALRAHKDAEIHIQDLAYKMLDNYKSNIPIKLKENEWHLPFGDNIDEEKLQSLFPNENIELLKLKIAVARCARLSYESLGDNPKIDYDADVKLHDRLLLSTPIHASPAEQIGKVMNESEFFNCKKTITLHIDEFDEYKIKNDIEHYEVLKIENKIMFIDEFGWMKNLRGFIPYRSYLLKENIK